MSNILEEIIATKRKEIKYRKEVFPVKRLEESMYFNTPTVSFANYIADPDRSGIIAEFKRKSPSKGDINPYAQVEEITIGYMQAGASALSILTDGPYFNGRSEDLMEARKFNFCPILRKDFTIDEYQIIEAKSIGADAILLISEVLTKEEVSHLAHVANTLGLDVLLEMHSIDQLDKLNEHIQVVGINNRDLKTFQTNIQTSVDVSKALPQDMVRISESGISDVNAIIELKKHGFHGFLIGEYFMQHAEPHKTCRRFIQEIKHRESL